MGVGRVAGFGWREKTVRAWTRATDRDSFTNVETMNYRYRVIGGNA